jgi:predicted Zn-dependent peptidase
MLEELEQFSRSPVSQAELKQAASYLAGQAEVNRQSGGALAAEILEAWMIGNELADLQDPGAAFHRVSADDVLQIAERYLRPLERTEGVVRGSGLSPRAGG